MNAFLFTLFIVSNVFSLSADTLSVNSEIKEVTVFRQQAQIERHQLVDLQAGNNIIVFKNLSPTLNQRSIQLQASGSFIILSLSQKFDYLNNPENNPERVRLQQLVDSLQNEIRLLQAELSVIDRELNLLTNSGNMINNNELTAAELNQLLDLYRNRSSKIEKEKIALNNSIQMKQKELNRVRAQLRGLGNSQQNRFSTIIAEIQSPTNQSLNFELSYLVRNAGWNPSYDIRGTDISSPLNLSYKASIYQNTGVDWNNVSLTVNSGNPSVNSSLPQILPQFLGFRNGGKISTPQVAMEEVVISAAPSYDSDSFRKASTPSVQFSQNQTSFSYKIETPYSVPSDGKEYTVGFRQEEIPASFMYATNPKLSEKAYLTANINNWNEYDLIPGRASIYFDKDYVGTTNLSTDSFQDSLQVSLGVDEGIIVERKKLRDFSESTFFGNKVQDNYTWDINLRNNKSREIEIKVKDLIPISSDENLEIENTQLSKGNYNKETGIITWTVKLQPGESKSIKFGYRLTYPKGRTLSM